MERKMKSAALVLSFMSMMAFAQEEIATLPAAAKAAMPKKINVIIADVGTINSVANTEKWLAEQLQPSQNIESKPMLEPGASAIDSHLVAEFFRWNMKTKQMEYAKASREIEKENAEKLRILRYLRTSTLSDVNQRNVILCKDFIQAALSRKYSKFIQIVDRGNVDMGIVEQTLQGKGENVAVSSGNCIVTVVMGDLETSSSTVTINSKGTKLKTTVYKQPYTGKLRDLQGNVLIAFDGVAELNKNQNNVVKSELANPTRELMQNACRKIADEIGMYFIKELKFKVKGPQGDDNFDADEVVVLLDGKTIDLDSPVYVIATEHEITAKASGYNKIQRIIGLSDVEGASKIVKLNFKKVVAAKEDDDEE